jgi:hypothetical protein
MNDPTDFNSFYRAMGLDSILWVARPKGFTHSIEKLPGTPSVPDIYDIELLTNLFFSVIGMPKEWLGLKGEGESKAVSGKALLAQDIRFLRKIKALRRPIINGYEWLGNFHSILRGQDVSQVTIKAKMSEIGSLDEQIKLEMLKAQAETLTELADVMKGFSLPREAWIEIIFKRYMHLPEDVVNTFITALPDQIQQESTHKKVGLSRALLEVKEKLSGNPRAEWLAEELRKLANGDVGVKQHRVLAEHVIRNPHAAIKPGDTVVSSFGPVVNGAVNESEREPKGYRRFNFAA